MLIGLLFTALVVGAGYGTVRLVGVAGGWARLGLAPAAGLALFAVLATWGAAVPLSPPLGTALLATPGVLGMVSLMRDRLIAGPSALTPRDRRIGLALLAGAAATPVLILAISLGSQEVPLSTHDGLVHVSTIHQLRLGRSWAGAYPPGLPASIALFLGLLPWLDSARGAFEASLALAVLAPLAVFGLARSIWRSYPAAGAAALIIALTFQFPYNPHIWSGWPAAAGVLLVVGLWTAANHYLESPRPCWILLGGLVSAGVVLTHGIEVYSAAIILVLVLIAHRRRLVWPRLLRDACLAALLALALAAPYLRPLIGWAQNGGATRYAADVLSSNVDMFRSNDPIVEFFLFWLDSVGAGNVLLIPARAVLLAAGIRWAFRRGQGRVLVPVFLLFYGLAMAFMYLRLPAVEQLFALTFPWGFRDRLGHLQVVAASVLCGAGLVAIAEHLPQLRGRSPWPVGPRPPAAWRRTAIVAVVLGLFFAEGSAVAVYKTLAHAGRAVGTYSADDAAAMAWLRAHARPGEVLANDWGADAGVWALYKANVPTLVGSRKYASPEEKEHAALLAKIAALDRDPQVRAAACAAGVRYVFRGAAQTVYEPRSFPSLAELRRSPALEEVFASGEAAVFRLHLTCDS